MGNAFSDVGENRENSRCLAKNPLKVTTKVTLRETALEFRKSAPFFLFL